jgi:quinolinate synthase
LNALQNEILTLKKEKNSIILGHNYQRKEVQEVSDFLGDSYGLSVQASKTDAKVIVFCGVDFMAESAKILNPEKIVLHPNLKSKCPMAAMVDVKSLRELKEEHPGAPVVSYVNTSADVKATSAVPRRMLSRSFSRSRTRRSYSCLTPTLVCTSRGS